MERTVRIHREMSDWTVSDRDHKVLNVGSTTQILTTKEYDLLKLLTENPNMVFSRESLLEKVWGFDCKGRSRAVDILIRRLREKLERDPSNPTYILTKWGKGYYYDSKSSGMG